MGASGRIVLDAFINELVTDAELVTGPLVHRLREQIDLANGTTPGKIDLVWSDKRTLNGSSTDTFDLAGGVSDRFGNALTFVEVVAVIVRNLDETPGDDLQVGPAASAGWVGMVADSSDLINVPANSTFLWHDHDGSTVTATTADSLRVVNGGSNAIVYEIIVIGRSA